MADKYADLTRKLHERGLELNATLRDLTQANGELIIKCESVLNTLKKFRGSQSLAAKIACSICLEHERSHIFLPCGHGGICEACSTRGVRRNRCFTCRGTVTGSLKVFL